MESVQIPMRNVSDWTVDFAPEDEWSDSLHNVNLYSCAESPQSRVGNVQRCAWIKMRKIAAECFGTFALVFSGTGAIIINDVTNGTVSHVGIALTFGLIVLAMIYAIGEVSGCHLNPAVTLGFLAARRLEIGVVIPYIVSQLVGALLASLLLKLMFPSHTTLGATNPAGSAFQSFVLEFILTLILMFVVLSVSTGAKEKGVLAGVAVGSVVALEALFAGPICGASMNPARSIAPAIASANLANVWIYLSAPILGALTSVVVCRCVHDAECCCAREPSA